MALALGEKAPSFSLPGVDDKTHSLEDFAGKDALAVIISCNHCPYVKAWEDRMVQIQSEFEDRGFQIVAINGNEIVNHPDDDMPSMKARAQEKSFNFPYLRDDSQEVVRSYGAQRTPEVFLFDKDMSLRYHGAIDDNTDPSAVTANYLRDAVEAVLSGSSPNVAQTPPVGCSVKWK